MISLYHILQALNLDITDEMEPFLTQQQITFKKLCTNSQICHADDLFIAIPGKNHTLESLMEKIVSKKISVAVVHCPERIELFFQEKETLFLNVPDTQKALVQLADIFYPLQPDFRVGVTGTNGKTSCTYFLRKLWSLNQWPAASSGTLGFMADILIPEELDEDFSLTTPSFITLRQGMNFFAQHGIRHMVFETSSHALTQKRLGNIQMQIGIFTNLTREHLDYHQTMEEYALAKTILFKQHILKGGTALLHYSLPCLEDLKKLCKERAIHTLTYGHPSAEVFYEILEQDAQECRIRVHIKGQIFDEIALSFSSPLQLGNFTAALAAFVLSGGSVEKVRPFLKEVSTPPGRLQFVTTVHDASIFIDYAHTPDALLRALQTLKPQAPGKIAVVFGAGGNRDSGKRSVMGKIAQDHADFVVITDDNPRFEDPATIRSAILKECPKAIECGDRGKAIEIAMKQLQPQDVLLIAGKGDETGQLIQDQILPFNDQECVLSLKQNWQETLRI
jgi:UDP-N-acetylmuramyl-tripeptide synthetase